MDLQELLRPNIRELQPYSCARDEFKGEAKVFLDANENPYNAPYNRYPDPLQIQLKASIARLKDIVPERIFFGNGSDEAIDLLYRAFCEPGKDNVIAIEPSYGMYKVCADINGVSYQRVLLSEDFQFSAEEMLRSSDEQTKLFWLCSPNNPSGNSLCSTEIEKLLEHARGIVVIDEAYIDFSAGRSFLSKLKHYPNLVILQTLSKAWGQAAIRFGMAFASEEIIAVLNKIKYPYNINLLTAQHAAQSISELSTMQERVQILLAERAKLSESLQAFPQVERVYPSDANFLLVKVNDAAHCYNELLQRGIVVRNRNSVPLCTNCLRISVGTPQENNLLLRALKEIWK